jgi:HAD superfamily hydrolase (TIGR01509 family)
MNIKKDHHKADQHELDWVIFDLDGTLIDTEPSAAKAIARSFQNWGIQVTLEDAGYVTGRTWDMAFQFLFSKYSIPVPQNEAVQTVLENYRLSLENELTVVPGSVQAVQSIASRYPLGLVSGSHRREILWALEKLGIRKHFQVILGAEDYPRSKPAPDGYLAALKEMKLSANRTLIFEDSHAGIASARAAGAWVVAITGTNHFQQDVSQAHFHISDLTPVTAEWVKDLGKKLRDS